MKQMHENRSFCHIRRGRNHRCSRLLGCQIRRRTFLLGAIALNELSASTVWAANDGFHVRGVLFFARQVDFAKGTTLSLILGDPYSNHGLTFGDGTASIANSRHPWSFSIELNRAADYPT